MPKLELLVSPPGTGKTTYCVDLFREQIQRSKAGIDSRCYFVLPSREHAERVQNLVLRKGVEGLFNAHIMSLNDLAEGILSWRGLGRPGESVRRLAVAEALAGAGPSGKSPFGYFGASAGLRGFQELALEAIREFKAGLLSIAEFEKRAQKLRKSDPVFAEKYRDFTILFKRYGQTLEALGFSEIDDELALLEDLRGAGRPPDLVIFDGFYHFTRAQKKLLTLISAWAGRTIVTLTLDPAHAAGGELFGYPERTRAFLKKAGFKESSPGSESRRTAEPGLRHLASHLFSPKPEVYAGTPPVSVLSAPSKRVEFEMIAREIRRLYREESCHYSDICVILRSVSGRRALIESVFGEFGVPAAVHERSRLLESGLAAALHRFFKLSAEGWLRDDLLYLAKSSYFRRSIPLEGAIELEKAALRHNVTQGGDAWKALAAKAGLSAGTARFIEELAAAESRMRQAPTPHGFGAAVDAFLKGLERPEGEASELDKAAAGSIASLLSSLRRRAATSKEFSAETAAREMLAAIEDGLLSVKPAGRNRVQVYDAVMALPKEYKLVFVADLLEKVFPQAVVEDPLFKDAERRALNGADPVLEERAWRLAGERYFFYMAVTRAREKVYLTHSTHDADGKPVLASFFIEETLRCLRRESVSRRDKSVSRFLPERDEWESEGDVARGTAALFASGGTARATAERVLSKWRAPEALTRAMNEPPREGGAGFSDPKALALLQKHEGPFSASSLETFMRCPFAFFAEHLLKLDQPLEDRADAEMGTVMHEVLYRYFQERLTAQSRRTGAYLKDTEKMKKELLLLLDEEFEKSLLSSGPLYRRALWLSAMKRMLAGYADMEAALGSRLIPTHFEYEFGMGKADPFRIPDASGEILLRGSVDRIDVDGEGGMVVIDYKKSSRSLEKKIEKGEEIQLPIYALAASRMLDLKVLGMEHRVLKTGEREPADLSPELIEELLAKTEERIRQTVRRIRGGSIEVVPKDCHFCKFDPVCRVEAKKKRG